MSEHDVPADAGDVEALAEVVGHVLSEYLDDAAPLNERRYVVAARHVLSVDGSPGMTAYFAARDAAQRAEGAREVVHAVEALIGPDAVFPDWGSYPHMFRVTQRRPDLGAEVTTTVVDARALRKAIARAGTAGGSDA